LGTREPSQEKRAIQAVGCHNYANTARQARIMPQVIESEGARRAEQLA